MQINEAGREAVLSFIGNGAVKFTAQLHGVERLLVTDMRQQNVVEDMVHWARGRDLAGLREAAFALMAGVAESDCPPQLAAVAEAAEDRVKRGELEFMEITAVYGAQVLALFSSMTLIDG